MNFDFMFCGRSASEFDIKGWPEIQLLPDRRKNTVELPGTDGSFDFGGDSYEPRVIPVKCLITAASRAELTYKMRQAAAWLSGSGQLIFGESPDVFWTAKVYKSIDPNRLPVSGEFTISFECQPFCDDVDETVGTIGTEQDYQSDRKFFPQIEVAMTEAGTYLQVSLLSTGEYVHIDDTLAVDDVITFDMATGSVKRNDTSIISKRLLGSRAFGIPPGDQTITVITDGECAATMTYRKRYLYA